MYRDRQDSRHPSHTDLKASMRFVNWDNRPAVLGTSQAFAMLKPASEWVSVDVWDVWETAGVMTEAAWRERFKSYGALNPPELGLSPGERYEQAS